MFAKQFYWYKLRGLLFKLRRPRAFQLSLCFLLGAYWLAGSRLPDGGGESHHFRGNRNPGPSRLPAPAPAAPHSPVFVSMEGPIMGLLYHLWGQSNIEIWVTLGGRTGSVFFLTTPPWETSYSRCFLKFGAEISFFCPFFLLCLGIGLPSRAEVFLYLT